MLPLGRKNAKKCSECGITSHSTCTHFVPDFCGMSMETANQLLASMKAIRSTQTTKRTTIKAVAQSGRSGDYDSPGGFYSPEQPKGMAVGPAGIPQGSGSVDLTGGYGSGHYAQSPVSPPQPSHTPQSMYGDPRYQQPAPMPQTMPGPPPQQYPSGPGGLPPRPQPPSMPPGRVPPPQQEPGYPGGPPRGYEQPGPGYSVSSIKYTHIFLTSS